MARVASETSFSRGAGAAGGGRRQGQRGGGYGGHRQESDALFREHDRYWEQTMDHVLDSGSAGGGSNWGWNNSDRRYNASRRQNDAGAGGGMRSGARGPRDRPSTGEAGRERPSRAGAHEWQDRRERFDRPERQPRQRRPAAQGHQRTAPAVRAVPPLTLRFKIVDSLGGQEKQREISVERTSCVGETKALHFAEELATGARLRVMFFGRELEDFDDWTQVPDGSVVQCFMVRWRPPIAETSDVKSDFASMDCDMMDDDQTDSPSPSESPGRLEAADASGPMTASGKSLMFGAGLMLAWGCYLADPEMAGDGCRVALAGASWAWFIVSGALCVQNWSSVKA